MNALTFFDKLSYVDRLRQAGVDEILARAHADGLEQAFREEVATKRDLKDVEVALKSEIAALDTKIAHAMHAQTFKIIGGLGTLFVVLGVVLHFWH